MYTRTTAHPSHTVLSKSYPSPVDWPKFFSFTVFDGFGRSIRILTSFEIGLLKDNVLPYYEVTKIIKIGLIL